MEGLPNNSETRLQRVPGNGSSSVFQNLHAGLKLLGYALLAALMVEAAKIAARLLMPGLAITITG